LRRVLAALTLLVLAAALVYVVQLVASQTIHVVEARSLLPRWDLATHLVSGWTDYHYLVTGRIHRLLWDLWRQGYWPPMHSIWQIPFYIVLGGTMGAGLWSSLVAFAAAGLVGSVILWRQWGSASVLPAGIFVALLISSPFLLAYASVAMTEMPGAAAELVVVLAYAEYRRTPNPRSASAFAISLTILFFTKYNYFLLLIAPLVLYEWLEWTSREGWAARLMSLSGWMRRLSTTLIGAVLVLYAVALALITSTGGFDFHLFGRRISVHSVGNTGHVVLYFLLARVWYLHRKGRIDWARANTADPRVGPLLTWFVLPVTIWFAIPYPNHIRDFANLVFNRPLGEAATGGGAATYIDALRGSYFYNQSILIAVIGAFAIAAVQYRRQPAWMRFLVVAIPVQFMAITVHQTRFPRFLLLTVVLLCLAAAGETARWLAGSRPRRVVGVLLVPAAVAFGLIAARAVVAQDRFQRVAFENYTDSGSLRAALQTIRSSLTSEDRLAIVGESNDLSPALFRWELGPPSGVACAPFQIGGADRLDPSLATRILLIEPLGKDAGLALDATDYYRAQRQAVLDRVRDGEFARRRVLALDDMHVALQLFDRTAAPERRVRCD
jgi:hypothetical protein